MTSMGMWGRLNFAPLVESIRAAIGVRRCQQRDRGQLPDESTSELYIQMNGLISFTERVEQRLCEMSGQCLRYRAGPCAA